MYTSAYTCIHIYTYAHIIKHIYTCSVHICVYMLGVYMRMLGVVVRVNLVPANMHMHMNMCM